MVLRRAWTPLLYRLPHTEALQLSEGSNGALQLEFASGILCLSSLVLRFWTRAARHRYLAFYKAGIAQF